MGTLYWSLASLLLGACVGSFLNVVIYRWPRNFSITRPSRSFCPNCGHQITWYENIPVLSYLFLRARCSDCRRPISLQYPLVELATALVFLITYDAFFVARQRMGITSLSADWVMLIAHWALGGMIVLAIMDLEAYMVDIRVTWILGAVGIIAHTFWTPAGSSVADQEWIRPTPEAAFLSIAASIGLLLGGVLFLWRPSGPVPEEPGPAVSEEPNPPPASDRPSGAPWLWLAVGCAIVAIYAIAMWSGGEQSSYRPPPLPRLDEVPLAEPASPPVWDDSGATRLLIGFALVFVCLTLVASRPHPEADEGIIEAIHAEARGARGQALWELKLLAPAILLSIAVLVVIDRAPGGHDWARKLICWSPTPGWHPVWGLTAGLFGWIVGGAIGWICRIVFTLVFGKEALGMGDVHILAAAGAVAGWPVACLGFFAAAILTLLAMVVIRLRRQSRALPYGPWLALAFLLCSIFQDRILTHLGIRWMLVVPVCS